MFIKSTLECVHRLEADGNILIWYDDDGQPHRDDGPAIKFLNKIHEEWLQHGEYHRVGGPAVNGIYNGIPGGFWWVRGKRMQTWKEYQKATDCSDEEIIVFKLKYGITGMVD
jgi:hypothetical protein